MTTFVKPHKVKRSRGFQCFYCSIFYVDKGKYEKHIKSCSELPGILYTLDTWNLVAFENNFKCKGDLPFVAYCDFETTTSSKSTFDKENY